MNPDTYAALYGPGRPAARRRGTEVAVVAGVLAGVLWAMALLVLACLGFLTLWAEADAGPTDGIPLRWVPIVLAIAAVPIGLLCTPAVRRLTIAVRALVTGLATFLTVIGLAVWTFVHS
ncbi:hypothetical protein RGF97_08845 [Streptomyces roseicoloratus]|uniref:Integral membrane protein n=1 Tax=Streptomyces roseicoloratus TaxID=2508722 RepID=A0ABY9RVL3_9ACTN|nr:hypothetical protein [Streptomyces roseicoloratus]WMX44940.1 hypothetical protein RGF97_08845 [Streptomyces roseicoloratus]